MRTTRMASLFVLGALVGAPAIARADTVSAQIPTDSDDDKHIGRGKICTNVIQEALRDWSFTIIHGERRKELVRSVISILMDEKCTKLSNGKFRLSYTISRKDVENRVLQALDVANTFGSKTMICVGLPVKFCSGSGITDDEAESAYTNCLKGATDYLNQRKFKFAPKSGDVEKVKQSAVALGVDPGKSATQDFARLFDAELVLSVKAQVKYETYDNGTAQHDAGFKGYLRAQQCDGRLYDRDTDNILAEFRLMSSADLKSEEDVKVADENGETKIHQPDVHKNHKVGEQIEKYCYFIGKAIGQNVARRVFEKYFEQEGDGGAAPAPGAAGPRRCPGCGDNIIDQVIKNCPSCDSPLPAGTGKNEGTPGTPGEGTKPAPVRPNPSQYFVIRLKGWTDTEVDNIMTAIREGDPAWGNWKEKGVVGGFATFNCSFTGEMIVKKVNEALESIDMKKKAKVNKTGNTIDILKSGGG